MKKFGCAVTFLVLALALSGCTSNKSSDGAVLARVNRNTITASDFKKQIEDLTPQMQQAVVMDPKARKEFMEDLIGIELVIQEAKKQGLDKDAEFKKKTFQVQKGKADHIIIAASDPADQKGSGSLDRIRACLVGIIAGCDIGCDLFLG